MSTEARILRLEQELAQVRRELRGGVARPANPRPLPAVRLAKIYAMPAPADTTDPTTHPLVFPYQIQFIDGAFTENSTVQTLDDTDRATTTYYACAPAGIWLDTGQITPVWWLNGAWWIFGGPRMLLGKSAAAITKGTQGVINIYGNSSKGSETHTGTTTVKAWNRFGDVASGKWVVLYWQDRGWDVVQAEC